jgi:protease I
MAQKKIACLLGDGFEDSEFQIPYQRFMAAGVEVEVVGPEEGKELTGNRGKITARADRSIDEAEPGDYDALFIPGGESPEHLRIDPRFVGFVEEFDHSGRLIAAVCHGPQLLISAGLVKGRTLTAYATVQEDLRKIGATVKDEPVVVDRNWITSRHPEDLEAFSQAVLAALREPNPAAREPEPAPAA